MGRSGSRRNAKKAIPKSRYWAGLKSHNNTRLNEIARKERIKKRIEGKASFDVNGKPIESIITRAEAKRERRRLKNLEELSRTTYN